MCLVEKNVFECKRYRKRLHLKIKPIDLFAIWFMSP